MYWSKSFPKVKHLKFTWNCVILYNSVDPTLNNIASLLRSKCKNCTMTLAVFVLLGLCITDWRQGSRMRSFTRKPSEPVRWAETDWMCRPSPDTSTNPWQRQSRTYSHFLKRLGLFFYQNMFIRLWRNRGEKHTLKWIVRFRTGWWMWKSMSSLCLSSADPSDIWTPLNWPSWWVLFL